MTGQHDAPLTNVSHEDALEPAVVDNHSGSPILNPAGNESPVELPKPTQLDRGDTESVCDEAELLTPVVPTAGVLFDGETCPSLPTFGLGGGIDMSRKRPQKDIVDTQANSFSNMGTGKSKQARVHPDVAGGKARAIHAELFHACKNVEKEPVPASPNVRDGGILAFGTAGKAADEPLVQLEQQCNEISSQELLLAAVAGEISHAAIPSQSCHNVQVFRDPNEHPLSLLVDKDATVGSITVAEERIGTMQQPIAVYTCIGTPVKLSEVTTPCQQIFLQTFSEGQRGLSGRRPQFFQQSAKCSRIIALWNQEAWVADDEMNHYLAMISTANSVEHVPACVMPHHVEDDELESILYEWFHKLMPSKDGGSKAISAFLVRDHWFPVLVIPEAGKIAVFTTQAGMSWVEIAIRKQGTEYTIAPVPFPLVTKFNNDCGFQTVAWLMDSLLAPEFAEPLHRVPPIEVATAIAWRQMFERQLILDSKSQNWVTPGDMHIGGADRPNCVGWVPFLLFGVWVPWLFQCFSTWRSLHEPLACPALRPPTRRKQRSFYVWWLILGFLAFIVASWIGQPSMLQCEDHVHDTSPTSCDIHFGEPGKEKLTSHRQGREDPSLSHKKQQEQLKQPGTGTQVPEKTTQQPGSRTQVPDKQTGSEFPELCKISAVKTRGLPPPMNFQAKPLAAFVPCGPSPHQCLHDEEHGDISSFMAKGRRSRIPDQAQGSISDMPDAAQQEDPDDGDVGSDSDTSSVSDPNWQNTELFTVIQPSVTRQLNIPHANLRRMQIASALNWATDSVAGDHPLAIRPIDMVENQIHARVIRHIRDLPPQHTQQLVLTDVEFHPPAPRFDFERIRMPIYALQFMSAIGFIRAMYLVPYCQYAILPCLLWKNGIYWSLEDPSLHRLHHGDYLRVVVPPPNPDHHDCQPRSLARALHLGFRPNTLSIVDNLIDDEQLQSMPNPYRILLPADAFPDPMEEVHQLLQLSIAVTRPRNQPNALEDCPCIRGAPALSHLRMHANLSYNQCAQVLTSSEPGTCEETSAKRNLWQPINADALPTADLCPRMQATLGHNDACPLIVLVFWVVWATVGIVFRFRLPALRQNNVPGGPCRLYQLPRIGDLTQSVTSGNVQRSEEAQVPAALLSAQVLPRISILEKQTSWVAVDEFRFYLRQLCLKFGATWIHPCIIEPGLSVPDQARVLHRWFNRVCLTPGSDAVTVTAVLSNHHWVPVLVVHAEKIVYTFATGHRALRKTICARGYLAKVLDDPCSNMDDMCGFKSIFVMYTHLSDQSSGTSTTDRLLQFADHWRRRFTAHLLRTGAHRRRLAPKHLPVGGAGTSDLHTEIATLLANKGVPPTVVEERASVVISKLGRQPIAQALRGQNPWREIKQLANFASPKVQLVLPSELESAVQARIATGVPFGDRRKKTAKQGPKPTVQLQAEDITIPDGIFRDANQAGISQIPIEAIGPEAQGVVVVNADQAVPYLRFAKPVSKFALALVVVNYQSPLVLGTGEEVRLPARCEKTSEPILLTAKVIQIGAVEVTRAVVPNPTRVEEVSAVVLRTCTYRDELGHITWEKFRSRPIKYVVDDVQCLQPDSQGVSPIIDVWDRQWLNDKLERTRPEEATLFCASFRVELHDFRTVLQKQGKVAHYLEPRNPDGRSPHSAFKIIWINKKDRQGVILAAQQTAQWTSIVRSGARYGLRVNSADAQSVHEFHKPNTPFLATDEILTFHAGPFPHGANRNALVKLFATWGWQARPSQPKSRAPSGKGVVWEVQAATKPPYEVYQLAHADVLITQVDTKTTKRSRIPNDIQGSARTIAALTQTPPATTSKDPWDEDDPWSNYQGPVKVPRNITSASIPQAQLDSIVTQVSQRLQPTRPILASSENGDAAMGSEDRVSALEDRMNLLEQTIQDQHAQQTIITTDLAGQIGNVQQQVDRQTQAIHSHIDSKMQEQLTHIERLLSKRRAE